MDEAPDDIEITPDQIQTPQEQLLFNPQEEISSFVKNENDTREESQSKDIKFTSYSKSGNPEQIENQVEQQLRSEEHTSELQSRPHLVCRLLLEKKKKTKKR